MAPLLDSHVYVYPKETFLAVARLGSDSAVPVSWKATISADLRARAGSWCIAAGGVSRRDLRISRCVECGRQAARS